MPQNWKLPLLFVVGYIILLILVSTPFFRGHIADKYSVLKTYVNSRIPTKIDDTGPSVFKPFSDRFDSESSRTFYDFGRTADSPTASGFYEFFHSQRYLKDEAEVWKNWNWEETMVVGSIVGIDEIERILLISIIYPSESNISGEAITVSMTCSLEETASFYSENLEYLGSGMDVFDFADAGDEIFTFCLDPSCKSIGKFCILIERTL